MPQDSVIYGVALVRSHEAGLIDGNDMDKLISLDCEGAMRFLSEKGYGGGEALPIDEFEKLIRAELKAARELIGEVTPDKGQTDIFLMRSDIQNLKLLLKRRLIANADTPVYMEGGLIAPETLEAMVEANDYYGLPEGIRDTVKGIADAFEQDRDPSLLSVRLDDAYGSYAIEHGSEFIKKYFAAKTDFDNLITVLRAKKMGRDRGFIRSVLLDGGSVDKDSFSDAADISMELMEERFAPQGCAEYMRRGIKAAVKTGRLYPIERERDNYLVSLASQGRGELESIAPIIGYLLAREQEARCLRLILTLKRNGIGEDIIRERLCELYG